MASRSLSGYYFFYTSWRYIRRVVLSFANVNNRVLTPDDFKGHFDKFITSHTLYSPIQDTDTIALNVDVVCCILKRNQMFTSLLHPHS